jgi:hypothetical protein
MDLPSDWIVGEGAKSPLPEAASRLRHRYGSKTLSEDAVQRSEGAYGIEGLGAPTATNWLARPLAPSGLQVVSPLEAISPGRMVATVGAIKASYRFAVMKIYFGFTVAGDRSSIDAARRIVALLQQKGHEVLTEHLVHDDAWSQDRIIPPQQVYQRDMKWLEQCDLFLAEVSGSSFGLGFEAGYLPGASAKKVALFYRREIADKISLLITGNSHPNCVLVPYTHLVELETFINDHV